MSKIDQLGDRMKAYENCYRSMLPAKQHVIMRLDGKAFHTYTKSMEKPYDLKLMDRMDKVAVALCNEISGVQFAYTQSDEISLYITDLQSDKTQMWFNGNIQKMVSVSASMATAYFNAEPKLSNRFGLFDSRVFTVPDYIDVLHYFIWRQEDAIKNSVSQVAHTYFSHKECHGKSSKDQKAMLAEKGYVWKDYPIGFQRGRFIKKELTTGIVEYTHRKTKEVIKTNVERSCFKVFEPPVFSKDTEYIMSLIKEVICTKS